MKVVKVVFDGNCKVYPYLCSDVTVKKGDWVVVMTPRGIPAIVTVTDVTDLVESKATKPILYKLCEVGITNAFTYATEKAEKYLDAKKRLDEKLAKFKEIGQYQLLALQDPEAAKLLEILKGKQ